MKPGTASAVSTISYWAAILFWNGCVASLFGALVIVSVFGLNVLVLAAWLLVVVLTTRRRRLRQGAQLANSGVMVQFAVMTLIVMVAHLAPFKTTEQVLDRTFTIPARRMTLEEIGVDPNAPRPDWRPHWIHMAASQDERAQPIEFPNTTVTLRQFVEAVESQSTLRHRFSHCGNGWTILYGGDCCFGIHLRGSTE